MTNFFNKWLFPRLTAINKQSNNDNLRISVMMHYPHQKINFTQRLIKATPKFWMKFSIVMLEVICKIFRLDFREVVLVYYIIDSVFYHKMRNTRYGVYKHNNVKISITKISKSFIDANKTRVNISELKNIQMFNSHCIMVVINMKQMMIWHHIIILQKQICIPEYDSMKRNMTHNCNNH